MAIPVSLAQRAQDKCELCSNAGDLDAYSVKSSLPKDGDLAVCSHCAEQLKTEQFTDVGHWRCLSDSMWSQIPAVQVMSWRVLNRLRSEAWAQDLLDMLYLDDELLQWAKDCWSLEAKEPSRDSNGVVLQSGDSVTVIKDLDVKGTSFTAKRGTLVRNISLCDNPEHIEGRVNGTRIVLLTCYLKKSA